MYSKQEASQLRKNFWTSFGQYMKPLRNADGETVNWLNYKTGIKHLYFRMDANNKEATIAIEMQHPDPELQQLYFEKFHQLQSFFDETVGEKWNWELHIIDEDGKTVSRIGTVLKGVNIFNSVDWPLIISFLKPRMIALDSFWAMVKDGFE
jgi:hypothetical protein